MKNDKVLWWPNPRGLYTVKSAYYLILNNILDVGHLSKDSEWNAIWILNLPQKVKVFLWKACRECLPMRQNLRSKQVLCPLDCVVCESQIENCWHSFISCPSSQACWQQIRAMDVVESFAELVFMMLEKLDFQKRHLFGWVLWSLWRRRNVKLWEDQEENHAQVIGRACAALEEWKIANTVMHEQPLDLAMNDNYAWEKPSSGRLKCM